MTRRSLSGALAAVAVPLALVGAGPAAAEDRAAQAEVYRGEVAAQGGGTGGTVRGGRSSFSAQHDGTVDHLPATEKNVELISKFEPTSQGAIVPGQIADLSVYKGFAYLNSWSEPTCTKGGFYVVDVRDPANPKEVAFRKARGGTYHGEGAHVISVDTPSFKGDIAAFNNEECNLDDPEATGGFDLYDVTDPTDPKALTTGAGDFTVAGADPEQQLVANSAHSVFLWQAGGKAYAVAVDNLETGGADVDIFDISDPRAVKLVREIDLDKEFPGIVGGSANGNSIFLHDMVVKEIGGRQIMLASYWDAGYVQIDVTDPANPTLVRDTEFAATEPLVPGLNGRPEGNGHQGEFSFDNRYILGADEDFSPYRLPEGIFFTTGPNAGQNYPGGEFGFTRPIVTLEGRTLNGPTVYGGFGCDPGDEIPARDSVNLTLEENEEAIMVISRGGCRFDEKIQNAADKGWDAVIIGNSHGGSGNGAEPDAAFCGGGNTRTIPAACLGHRAMHLLFGREPGYTADAPDEPEPGERGERVTTTPAYDGWGYTHLFDAQSGKEIDAFAIEEGIDERYSFGFGDLSVHEFATDPETNLAYSAYYAGGFRVLSFGPGGLEEQGRFIDQGGNNFWGVEQFTDAAGNRLIALSDRDFGLYVFKYTGPGAVLAKPPAAPTPTPEPFTVRPSGLSLFRVGQQKIKTVRRRGVKVTVKCPGFCPLVMDVRVDAGTRRRLGLNRARIGRLRTNLTRGRKTLRVKLNRAARKAMRNRKQMRVIVVAAVAGAEQGARSIASVRLR